MLRILTTLTIYMLFASQAYALNGSCAAAFRLQAEGLLRNIERIDTLRFLSFNLEDLYLPPSTQFPELRQIDSFIRHRLIVKNRADVLNEAQLILKSQADIISLQEVVGISTAEVFAKYYLEDKYYVFSIPGNDSKNIVFLVKKDLPFSYELRSYKNRRGTRANGYTGKIHTRDVPILLIRPMGKNFKRKPLLVLAGLHLKSKYDKFKNPTNRRAKEVADTVELLSELQDEFPDIPQLLMGDFNGDPNQEVIYQPFKKAGFTDAFSAAPRPLSQDRRITVLHFLPDETPVHSQADAFLLSQDMVMTLMRAEVMRFSDTAGAEKPLPQTKIEKNSNPSNHFPIFMEIKFQMLMARYLMGLR